MLARTVFSKRLQQLRLEKGVTQEKMSIALGFTKNYIYNIEADYAYPTFPHFFAICEYLDVTPAEFLQIEPETTGKEDDLWEIVRGFSNEQMDRVIAFAREIGKNEQNL